jgi:hypothetical protein
VELHGPKGRAQNFVLVFAVCSCQGTQGKSMTIATWNGLITSEERETEKVSLLSMKAST